MGRYRAVRVLLVCFACSLMAWAGSQNATVSGGVYDASGKPLPGIRVVMDNAALGFEREATTGDDGSYTVTEVPPSDGYRVTAYRGAVKLDVDLCDDRGNIRAQMRGLCWRQVSVEVEESVPVQVAQLVRREIVFTPAPLAQIVPIDRTNPASNLIPAGMTSEIAANASNLLSDIKPGYMLGAKPRQQAVGHVIGIVAGAVCCVPLFFLLFLPPDANGVRSTATIVSEQFAMPAALQWKGVAEIIAKGLSALPHSAIVSMAVAALSAVAIEVAKIVTKGRFPLSAVAIGLGVVLPPESTLAMFVGALVFWIMKLRHPAPGTRGHEFWVEGMEPMCAGLISGSALVGIGNAVVNVLL